MKLAPIVVLSYNRASHLKQVLEKLLESPLAKNSKVFIFIDGLKNLQDNETRNKVIEVASLVEGFYYKEVFIHEANMGIKKSAIYALNKIAFKYEKVIYLEDDTVPQTGFLEWMNEQLTKNEYNQDIYAISGYSFPFIKDFIDFEGYYSYRFSPWGFGTWARALKDIKWNSFKLHKLLNPFYWYQFNHCSYGWGYGFLAENLFPFLKKYSQTWDIEFFYHHYNKRNKNYSPRCSYIENIGFDGSGTHHSLDLMQIKKQTNKKKFVFTDQKYLNLELINQISSILKRHYLKKSLKTFFQILKRSR